VSRSADEPTGALMTSTREIGAGTVLAVRGELSLRTVPQLRRAVEKPLADRGRVLVDLSGLAVLWRPALEVFPAALAAMTGWPAARLVLFGAGPGTARLLGAAGRLTAAVHTTTTEAEAVALLEVRPRRLIRRAELPGRPEAAKWGRLLVEAVCADWDVGDAELHAARTVVSELVTNAVLHARTSCVVTLTLTDRALQIGVRDYLPGRGPLRGDAAPAAEGPLGMVVVDAVSRGWGVTHHDDGKTVWATIARPGTARQGRH
jgi:anti-sigma regulatory factor (Ser/Thr protein kinase)/anti-anti-sigma regulatory factor